MITLSGTTCGEACWAAKEDVCRGGLARIAESSLGEGGAMILEHRHVFIIRTASGDLRCACGESLKARGPYGRTVTG